jgi:hypothetical protein
VAGQHCLLANSLAVFKLRKSIKTGINKNSPYSSLQFLLIRQVA